MMHIPTWQGDNYYMHTEGDKNIPNTKVLDVTTTTSRRKKNLTKPTKLYILTNRCQWDLINNKSFTLSFSTNLQQLVHYHDRNEETASWLAGLDTGAGGLVCQNLEHEL